MSEQHIKNGVYLVLDPGMELDKLQQQLVKISSCELSAIQIWDNMQHMQEEEINEVFDVVFDIFGGKNIPILINNRWEYLNDRPFDGVHFDHIPLFFEHIVEQIKRPFLKGLTLNNDLSVVSVAEKYGFSYFSFCSMFSSQTSNSCEIVHPETIKTCRQKTEIPIFVAGGITPQNLHLLNDLDYNGVALISGIMKAENPVEQLSKYTQQLNLSK